VKLIFGCKILNFCIEVGVTLLSLFIYSLLLIKKNSQMTYMFNN